MSASREVTLASVRKLKPNTRNTRTHSKKQIQEIVELIRRFGWTYPILVDENGCIIAGHARYQAALYLRLTRVPIIIMTGLSDAERRALALADNKVPMNAGWDRAALAADPNSGVSKYNPLGKIPVLICDDKKCIYDSSVIVEYLDALSSTPKLIPESFVDRIEVKRWQALGDGIADSAILISRNQRQPPAMRQSAEWHPNQQKRSTQDCQRWKRIWVLKHFVTEIPSPLPTSHVEWRSDILTALYPSWIGEIHFQDLANMPSDWQSARHLETRFHRHSNRHVA